MDAWLYNNNSDVNKLDKDLRTLSSSFPCTFKDDTTMEQPELIFNSAPEVLDANYLWLGEPFNRYYFITNKTVSQGKMYVKCDVDVLMSFKTDIRALQVIAERSSSNYNIMQIDSQIPIENFNDVATKEFNTGFSNESFILAVTGKV